MFHFDHPTAVAQGSTLVIEANDHVGDRVRVQFVDLDGNGTALNLAGNGLLSLAEVQVFGETPTAVPEPTTLSLLSTGLLGLLGYGWRSRKRPANTLPHLRA